MATTTDHPTPESSASEIFSFSLHLAGIEEITEELENRLSESGCSDALLGIQAGTPFLAFDRASTSFVEAIRSAIRDVEGCGLSIHVTRVVPQVAETIEFINAYLQ